MYKYCTYGLLLMLLAGCGAIGLAPAKSFNDRAAYALSQHTAVLQTTTRALEAGDITSAEAEDLAALADRSRDLIDTARGIAELGQMDNANQRLALATTILRELQAYLRREGT